MGPRNISSETYSLVHLVSRYELLDGCSEVPDYFFIKCICFIVDVVEAAWVGRIFAVVLSEIDGDCEAEFGSCDEVF